MIYWRLGGREQRIEWTSYTDKYLNICCAITHTFKHTYTHAKQNSTYSTYAPSTGVKECLQTNRRSRYAQWVATFSHWISLWTAIVGEGCLGDGGRVGIGNVERAPSQLVGLNKIFGRKINQWMCVWLWDAEASQESRRYGMGKKNMSKRRAHSDLYVFFHDWAV